jgi:glucoamylase
VKRGRKAAGLSDRRWPSCRRNNRGKLGFFCPNCFPKVKKGEKIMKTKKHILTLLVVASLVFFGALDVSGTGSAFCRDEGGAYSIWNYAGKTGIGTSYERYLDKQYSDAGPTGTISKVWFSISKGIVTETAYGMIHEAQIKDLQFLITGSGFFDEEKADTDSRTEYLHADGSGRPLSLAYRVTNTDKEGKYKIEKHIFTDPDRQTLFMRVIFTANEDGITPYILINPHMKNTGSGDVAYVGGDHLNAREGNDMYLSLKSTAAFVKTSAGFVGESDGWTDLNDNNAMDWEFDWADKCPDNPDRTRGNVAMMAQLQTVNTGTARFDIAIGFGKSHAEAISQADGSLSEGYSAVLKKYNGVGGAIGWKDYIGGLSSLSSMVPYTGDNGKQLYASALVLKALEDKTHAGALIASLSIPWGDTVSADGFQTGYRAVWPRDFYQCAMAFLAMGDKETPLVSFEYLKKVQVDADTPGNSGAAGWFLQKSHVNGTPEWYRVQMDQTAMPVMLGWKLWKAGILSDSAINTWYGKMLKPAAEFLANGGNIDLSVGSDRYTDDIVPPFSRQERWEEQRGYSPSTTAAIITGLIAAADIARNAAGDPGAASFYETKADCFSSNIERYMFTTTGTHAAGGNNGRYYLRITQNQNPNDGHVIDYRNGRPAMDEREVLDAGFLELVRYGVRPADDPDIKDTLTELDDTGMPDENLRVKYDFKFEEPSGSDFPGWRRYGNDGYGERENDGSNFRGDHPENRGRVWPFLTGERGHYELERTKAENGGTITDAQINQLRDTYVRAMEYFANEGLMLPEQVWDGVGNNNAHNFASGEGTNSATPLAWTHAEYVKLVKSLADGNAWDSYSVVRDRYSKYQTTFPRVFFRGTPNGWGTNAMSLAADFTWKTAATFGSGGNERFKFDLHCDWSHNYGDNPPVDGVADRTGADIPVTRGAGDYAITFNDQTRVYTVAKKDGGFNSTFPRVFFRGTPNGWGATMMNLVADYKWEITVTFGSGSSERFKFDVHGDWSQNYGDNPPQDGVADQTGADIPVSGGAGSYTITFNDQTRAYEIVKN